jgi:hypothetical protein
MSLPPTLSQSLETTSSRFAIENTRLLNEFSSASRQLKGLGAFFLKSRALRGTKMQHKTH